MFITGGVTGSSSPKLDYTIHAEQIGSSGTNRTIKVTCNFKVAGGSSSFYGYPVKWKARIHKSYSDYMTMKGNERWHGGQGYRSYSWTATVNVGTTATKDITVGFQTDAFNGSNSWDAVQTGTFKVGATNSAPYFTSGNQYLNIREYTINNPVIKVNIIPENITALCLNWGSATDDEGGVLNYALNQSVNGAGWNRVYFNKEQVATIQIGDGNEGEKRKYYVQAQDNGGLWSNQVHSIEITKNTFTPNTISAGGLININTATIPVAISGANNTNGNTTFTNELSSSLVKVYNGAMGGSGNLTLVKGNDTANTPYVKFEDLKRALANSNYTGLLPLTLSTTNAYGSKKSTVASIECDLKADPVSPTSFGIDAESSTAYKTMSYSGNSYYIPKKDNYVRLAWDSGVDELGGRLTYNIQANINNTGYVSIANNIAGDSFDYYTQSVSKVSTVKFKLTTVTSYGSTAEKESNTYTMHYYNSPTLTVGGMNRTDTTVAVEVTVFSASSIPNISTIGSWRSTSGDSGTLTASQNKQTITLNNLNGDKTYNITVSFNDNTELSTTKEQVVRVSPNKSVFFVNKYGIGVNGAKADVNNPLIVEGNAKIDSISLGTVWINTPINFARDIGIIGGDNAGGDMPKEWCSVRNFSIGDSNEFGFQMASDYSSLDGYWLRGRHDYDGSYKPWAKIYTDRTPPSINDISGFDIISLTKSMLISSNWTDVDISGTALSTGTYVVSVFISNPAIGFYAETWSGIMSWYGDRTNDGGASEIVLHSAGHAPNGNTIYLRTAREIDGVLRLQLCWNKETVEPSTIEFKFRKLL